MVFSENFEKGLIYTKEFLNKSTKVFMLDSYLPKEREFINLFSDVNDSSHAGFYTDNRCNDSIVKRGFYIGLEIYHRAIPSAREILAIKLDSTLVRNKIYYLSLLALFHKYTNYRVDSIQALFLSDEKDIPLWLKGQEFSGQYVGLSLSNTDNQSWRTAGQQFAAEHDYQYMLIGNLQRDEDCVFKKVNNCHCCPRPKSSRDWDYGELLIDDIQITF